MAGTTGTVPTQRPKGRRIVPKPGIEDAVVITAPPQPPSIADSLQALDGTPPPRPQRTPPQRTTTPVPYHILAAATCALGGLVGAWGLAMASWPDPAGTTPWLAAIGGLAAAGGAWYATPRQGPWGGRVAGLIAVLAILPLLWGGAQALEGHGRQAFAHAIDARLAAGLDGLDLRPPAGDESRIADSIFIPAGGADGMGIACIRKGDTIRAQAVLPGATPHQAVSAPWALRDPARARGVCAEAFAMAHGY